MAVKDPAAPEAPEAGKLKRIRFTCRFCGHSVNMWTRKGLFFRCRKCKRYQEGPGGLGELPALSDPLPSPKKSEPKVRKLRILSGPPAPKPRPASAPAPAAAAELPAPQAPVDRRGLFDRLMGF